MLYTLTHSYILLAILIALLGTILNPVFNLGHARSESDASNGINEVNALLLSRAKIITCLLATLIFATSVWLCYSHISPHLAEAVSGNASFNAESNISSHTGCGQSDCWSHSIFWGDILSALSVFTISWIVVYIASVAFQFSGIRRSSSV